ncbi:PH domain-containing protein [candidate division WWE3 bacterium]|uniref:PH domain-containing protein n=1 Tax=candidate division WWE3 bacterium TaxID=2053526 RepID=A0A955LJU1_UNCKA|nr:PH domain-containing protein [candidate division WWE3 bacterium]
MKEKKLLPMDVELEPGEEFVMLVRQHWFVFRDPFLMMFFAPFVLLSAVFFLEYTTFPENVVDILSMLCLYAAGISFVAGFLWFVWKFYLWKNTVYLLTSKRIIIINQLGLFTHDDRETGLKMIQDVRARVDGLQPTLYGYGDVILQVSSEDAQLRLEKVAHPREVQRIIIREAHLKDNGVLP